MGKILCYIYEGMADFEIGLLLHRLRNTGKKEIIAISETKATITAQSGLHYMPDMTIVDIYNEKMDNMDANGNNASIYEALIIPGGPINNEQNAICPLIKKMILSGGLVAAICFAPQFLGRAGILDTYTYTTSCSEEKIKQLKYTDPFNRRNFINKRCVTDRNLITAQGYAFVDFTEAVCDYLNIFENENQKYQQIGRIKEH